MAAMTLLREGSRLADPANQLTVLQPGPVHNPFRELLDRKRVLSAA